MSKAEQSKLCNFVECQRLTGVTHRTIRKWVASGKLKRQVGGLIRLSDVEAIKDARKRGRPYNLPADQVAWTTGDEIILSSPFLTRTGLKKFQAVAARVVQHHARHGNKKAAEEILCGLYAILTTTQD